MYYLQSRYYDPEIGRFINADEYTSTGQGLVGNNMFAYCNNNPVMYCDTSGDIAHVFALAIVGGIVGAIVGATAGAIFGYINAKASGTDPMIGAKMGAISGGITGAVTGVVGAIGGPAVAKVAAVTVNAIVAGYCDYKSQRLNYEKTQAGLKESEKEPFRTDWGSIATASGSAGIGTAAGFAFTGSETVTEIIASGVTGGQFASWAAGAFEMLIRAFAK